uniref:Cyclin n=1 Tax=Helianthus annuus TaxID=4232 RepID=F1C971_HELAN|nr:cyclin [Helianthus annuus]
MKTKHLKAKPITVADRNTEEGEANNSRLQSFFSSLLTSIGGVFGHTQEQEVVDMTSNECVVPVPPPNRDVKQNNDGQIERRNRRALVDIGNLAPTVVEIGKPNPISRPVTRSLKPQDETPRRRSKKPSKSLTTVLTARSKVACGITTRPKDPVVNIDEADINNELAEVEYVEDIYTFYKLSETEGGLQDYMNSNSQPDLNAKMRAILIDWLIEVHRKFELMPESLYLTINVVDRYLSVRKVPRRELQLVGISALLIACKYEEIWPPEVTDLIAISDNAFPREQILTMEKAILGHLGWFLTVPTPYVFLVRYTKASVPFDSEMENMVFFLTELGLIHYSVVITNSPSKLAASAVYAARCTLKKTPAWTETLKHHTGYYEDELRECAKTLVTFHDCASETKLKAVYRKYVNPEKGAVALFPPARDLTAEPVLKSAQKANALVLVNIDHTTKMFTLKLISLWAPALISCLILQGVGILWKKVNFSMSSGSGIWNDRFVNEMTRMVGPKMSTYGSGFGFLAGKLLETKGGKLQRADEAPFTLQYSTAELHSQKGMLFFINILTC